MWSVEENKTYVGIMMRDLRGSWASNYVGRMEDVRNCLEEIVKLSSNVDDIQMAKEDIQVINEEIEDGSFDGRVFRDNANFYEYYSKEGFTESVISMLKNDMEFPEYIDDYSNYVNNLSITKEEELIIDDYLSNFDNKNKELKL